MPFSRLLESGLVIKSIHHMDDVDRLSAFIGTIHGDLVAQMTRHLIVDHPHTRPEHWLFAEDTATREIVSMLCLIPWDWHFDSVALRCGELGIVGTHPDYRRRGLSRALTQRHHELLREGGYDLSHIQGIPYFYRQFGYDYAIPLEGGWRVELHAVPEKDDSAFTFRQATEADIPVLMGFFDAAAGDVAIGARRDEATWRYLFGASMQTETAAETWLVLDQTGQPAGYYRIGYYGFSDGLIVNEGSRFSHAAAEAVLAQCKALAVTRALPYIHLKLPANHVLIHTAKHMSAHDTGTYAWQMLVPDKANLLQKLAPVFERRMNESAFAGWSGLYVMNLFREAFEMRFEGGKLVAVSAVGFREGGDIHLPPVAFAPLVLGYRTIDELNHIYHDASCWDKHGLADVLFPKMDSYLYTIY